MSFLCVTPSKLVYFHSAQSQVIARADELTSARLAEVKAAVSRALRREGLGWGVLDVAAPIRSSEDDVAQLPPPLPTDAAAIVAAQAAANGASALEPPIPLIRTRSRSRSVTRARRTLVAEDEVPAPDTAALQEMLPFALLAPEDPAKASTRTYKVRGPPSGHRR
jgi:hypothetical protein